MKNPNTEKYDDCPMCRAQMKADMAGRELTLEEFIAASRDAERAGGIVGSMRFSPFDLRNPSPEGFPMEQMDDPFTVLPFYSPDMAPAEFNEQIETYVSEITGGQIPFINRPPAEA